MRSFLSILLLVASVGALHLPVRGNDTIKALPAKPVSVAKEANALVLPVGFSAQVIGNNLGRARHIAVHSNGEVFIKLERLRGGKGIARLRDKNKDGKVDDTTFFGNYVGTGIAIKNGYLYASSNSAVYRYPINSDGEVSNTDNPEVVVTGLVDERQHSSKSIALDNAGNLYVNIGAPSNACQAQDRAKDSPGQDPCPILERAGGIWQFKADGKNQSYAEGVRYATGLRNVVGLDWNNTTNSLFVVMHGRDQLSNLYPNLYTDQQSAELPAEEMFEVKQGDDFGWPYCYYDPIQNKKVQAPEYGGDGKQVGRCADARQPIVAFPAHLSPNGLLFYTGNQFPEKYRNGAFIAFHGSWNRAPLPQKGFFVAFVPFKDGKPSGKWETFADGFAGKATIMNPKEAQYRPCGLAQGPDGSLYVTDDVKGAVWKISFTGK
jgi:glucose/arabinose dehydrogenase